MAHSPGPVRPCPGWAYLSTARRDSRRPRALARTLGDEQPPKHSGTNIPGFAVEGPGGAPPGPRFDHEISPNVTVSAETAAGLAAASS